MIHTRSIRALAPATVALMGVTLAVAPLRAQTPATPPAPVTAATPVLLQPSPAAPSPATVRPRGFRAQLPPTPAVVLPAAAGSAPPSTVAPAPAPAKPGASTSECPPGQTIMTAGEEDHDDDEAMVGAPSDLDGCI